MEAFHPSKPEKHRHHYHHHHHPPQVEFLQGGGGGGGRYATKSHGAPGNAFNSWNDYLGLATLITKAVSQEKKGFRTGSSSVVVAAAVQQVPATEEGEDEEEEEEDDEEEEEDDDEEDEDDEEVVVGAPYFQGSLDLHDFDLCGHHRHHHHHHHLDPSENLLEERFAGFSPFSGRASPASALFDGSADHLGRDRSPHAWGGRLVADACRLPAPPKSGAAAARLLKPELQVCVFCRNNKEAVALYTTHILKGPDGRVLCPVLRRYTCPLCGASGDNAHTIKYCPLSKMHGSATPLKPPLKNARHVLGKKLR